MDSDINAVLADLHEYWEENSVWSLIWKNNPFYTLMEKDEDFAGEYFVQAVKYVGSQGVGGDFGIALANVTAEKWAAFHVPMSPVYAISVLQNSAILASRNKRGAFEDLVSSAVESGIQDAANEIARGILSGGTATIGQIVGITQIGATGTYTVQLSSSLSYQFFENGMTLDATVTDGGAPAQANGSTVTATVIAVDASAGQLTIQPNVQPGSFGTYFIVGAYLIRDGNYFSNGFNGGGGGISSAYGSNVYPAAVAGIGAWMPTAAQRAAGILSTAFLNVVRSADGTRLAGVAVNGMNRAMDEALIDAATQTTIYGGSADYGFLNPVSYAALLRSLQGQKNFVNIPAGAKVGDGTLAYSGIVLHGGPNPITIMSDRNVPPRTAYLIDMKTWKLRSMGKAPNVIRYPGGTGYVVPYNQDAIQVRVGGYFNPTCSKPSANAIVSLSA